MSVCLCLSLFLLVCLCPILSVCLSVWPSIFLFVSDCRCITLSLSLSLFPVSVSLCLSYPKVKVFVDKKKTARSVFVSSALLRKIDTQKCANCISVYCFLLHARVYLLGWVVVYGCVFVRLLMWMVVYVSVCACPLVHGVCGHASRLSGDRKYIWSIEYSWNLHKVTQFCL